MSQHPSLRVGGKIRKIRNVQRVLHEFDSQHSLFIYISRKNKYERSASHLSSLFDAAYRAV